MARMLTHDVLLQRIDRHLAASGETPTRFGRRVARDGNLVRQLRAGRSPRLCLVEDILRATESHVSENSATNEVASDAVSAGA